MHKTLAEQGPSTPALAMIFKYEFRLKTESSYIKKQSLQNGDVTAQVQRNHITEQTNKRLTETTSRLISLYAYANALFITKEI